MANPFDSTNQTHVAVRPINKGMFQNLPSNGLPDGAFWRIQNYRVETAGLARRGGFTNFNQNTGTGSDQIEGKMLDIIYFYQRTGGAEQLLLTDRHLYLMQNDGSNERMDYINVTGTVITSSPTTDGKFNVTLPMTQDQIDRVRPGDFLNVDDTEYTVIGATASGSNGVISCYGDGIVFDQFIGLTATLTETFLSEVGMGTSYAVLPSVANNTVDKVVIADQAGRGMYQYTSGTLEPFVLDSTGTGTEDFVYGGKAVTYFDDRLWFCNTEEVDGEYRQRIRWSNAVSFDVCPPSNYTDLPYSEDQILRLVPLGSLLVAYYGDAIYVGRRTNMTGQPYFFERVESGNIGLVNSRAIVRHTDTHYFVGEDNIYMLSGSAGFVPMAIGDAVLEEALFYTKNLDLMKEIQVEHDLKTKSIVFMFPDKVEASFDKVTSLATRLWRYYYQTQAWAYDETPFETEEKQNPSYHFSAILPSNTYVFGRSWDDWYNLTGGQDIPFNASWTGEGDPDATPVASQEPAESFADFETWTALANDKVLGMSLKIGVLSAPLGKQLIVEEQDKAEEDEIGSLIYPIWALIESGDFDVGMPDYTKTVTRLSLKAMHIYSERESSLVEVGGVFTLNISDAMGYHWKRPLTLRFKSDYNEGYANFRSTGSTFRFKLVSSQVIAPYRLSEYIMRMVGRGLQVEN